MYPDIFFTTDLYFVTNENSRPPKLHYECIAIIGIMPLAKYVALEKSLRKRLTNHCIRHFRLHYTAKENIASVQN